MSGIIFRMVVWFLHTETAKLLAVRIIRWIVEKTENGIDDKLADELLDNIVKSKKNKISEAMISDAKKAIREIEKEMKK